MNRSRIFRKTLIAVSIVGLTVATPSRAMDLIEAFTLAQTYDPAYQAAKADRAVNDADALVAKLAYLPTASASYNRDSVSNLNVTTVQVVQPVFDLERFATMRESAPREVMAEATFRLKEQDLAARVVKLVTDVIKTRETIVFSDEQVKALTEQANRSQRRFDLGQGTITEVSTAKVRLDQARAIRRQLEAQRIIVEKQFQALTGVAAPVRGFQFTKEPVKPRIETLQDLLDRVMAGNANVILARAGERMAELNQQKVAAAYLPQVNAVARQTKVESQPTDRYGGLQISIPLGISASNFAGQYKAKLGIDRAREVKRDVEEKSRLETERLWSLVTAGGEELVIRKAAVDAAELSAQGNIKSYEAGVVSAVDVINAILVVFDVKREYLNVLAQTVENFLLLQMTVSEPPVEALRRVQSVLLETKG